MLDRVTYNGTIVFEPVNYTKKHEAQSSWKRVAMVQIEGDICEYYSWFIQKRYNLMLNKPLRNAHVTFINDSLRDLSCGGTKSLEQIDKTWNEVKDKWENKIIPITLNLDIRSDYEHWWFNIPEDEREILHGIRAELGLLHHEVLWNPTFSLGCKTNVTQA